MSRCCGRYPVPKLGIIAGEIPWLLFSDDPTLIQAKPTRKQVLVEWPPFVTGPHIGKDLHQQSFRLTQAAGGLPSVK